MLTKNNCFSAGLFFSAGMFAAAAVEPPAKPNIVLIMADDLGWNDVSYHQTDDDRKQRSDLAWTPNIDRISSEGIRFENFYTQPICTPTRAALMTGRYSWRTGMASGVILNHLKYGLPLDETTMGQMMKNAGYATYIIGKWHLGHETPEMLPTERGFDYHYGLYTAIDHFTHEWQGGLDWHRNRKTVREEGYATDLLGEDCVRIIKSFNFDKKPLFLYHPMFAVHAWNQAPEKYTAPYSQVESKDRHGLLGLCAAMDYQFGNIIDALKDAGQLENTLIVFLSDNGGNLRVAADNGPLLGSKGTYYQGGVRVPAFAYWKGKIDGGQTSEALMHVTDLFKTFSELSGAPLPEKPLDGFDLSPVLFSGAKETGRTEIPFILEDSERQRRGAIIDWPWKLRRTATDTGPWVFELYNLEKDPYEKEEGHVTARAHSEITERLSSRLDELKKEMPEALFKKGDGNAPKGWKASPVIGPDK